MINFDLDMGPTQGIDELNALCKALNLWQPNTDITVGQTCRSSAVSSNSLIYYEATKSGKTGAAEPAFDGTVGKQVNDGTVIWNTKKIMDFSSQISSLTSQISSLQNNPAISSSSYHCAADNSGTGYIEFNNGLLIQFGVLASCATATVHIAYPLTFSSVICYSLSCSVVEAGGVSVWVDNTKTTFNGFYACIWDGAKFYNGAISWVCIGQ